MQVNRERQRLSLLAEIERTEFRLKGAEKRIEKAKKENDDSVFRQKTAEAEYLKLKLQVLKNEYEHEYKYYGGQR